MYAKRFLALAVVGLLAASSARATVLPPDGTSVTPTQLTSDPVGTTLTQIASRTSGPLTDQSTAGNILNVTLNSYVFRVNDSTSPYNGDLAFGWRITNNSASNTFVERFTAAPYNIAFGPYDAAFYQASNERGAANGSTVLAQANYDSSTANQQIGFNLATGASFRVDPGTTSALLLVYTTAKTYGFGTAGVHDTNVAINTFTTFAPTPEPGTMAIALAGLPVIGSFWLRRHRSRA